MSREYGATAGERRRTRLVSKADAAGVELSPRALELVSVACDRAPYLASLLAHDPTRLLRVDDYLQREKPAEQLALEVAEATGSIDDDDEFDAVLRRIRGDEMVRLGYRELVIGSPIEVGRELSNLADLCLQAAIDFHRKRLNARFAPALTSDGKPVSFCVFGMGKLGGEELNFSSDIDLIYVYETDDGQAGDLTVHQYFEKLCRKITASISTLTEDGLVFRLDLRLRPEGSRGAICNSLPSLETYYETFGRPWERQAWLKARASAGATELADEILKTLHPFIYPRSSSPRIIDDVRELNQRIKTELLSELGVEAGYDVKNGVGGIREVEFFTQALQMIHGGRNPDLRSRSTLTALSQLAVAGLINEGERETLSAAYQFLRHVEHVLQLNAGRQTQRIPTGTEAATEIARRLGYESFEAFEEELTAHTDEVAAIFETLGEPVDGPSPKLRALLRGALSASEEVEALNKLGFSDPSRAAALLERARVKPSSPLTGSTSGPAARVVPRLFMAVVDSPAPDQGLGFLSDLISVRGRFALIWRVLDANEALSQLIGWVFGTSEYIAKRLVENPGLTDALLTSGRTQREFDKNQLREELTPFLAGIDAGDHEALWSGLAAFKNAQVVRVGLSDLAGDLEPDAVCRQLSSIADVCVEQAFEWTRSRVRERHGDAQAEDGGEATMAVLALGKLGGSELGYASDLDVVFVYSEDGASDGQRPLDNITYMSRVAQRLMGALHAYHPGGRLYEVDARLRPSGSKGLLVSSFRAWRRYHHEQARPWEKQATTKLRFIAGDPELGQAAIEAAHDSAYHTETDPAELADAVHTMRLRMELEQSSAGNIKTGRGGVVDIEFAAQFLGLAYGGAHLEMRTASTADALSAAASLALADAQACTLLVDGYWFLRRLEHRMRIVHDRPVHTLPSDEAELHRMARRVGMRDGDALSAQYKRWTDSIRRAYLSLLGVV